MDAEIKAKWLAALRSGEYKQGQGALKAAIHEGDIHHCCLGVLCEVMNVPQERKEDTIVVFDGGYSALLPPDVQAKADILMGHVHRLAEMNDTGYSFTEIAKYIEENV